MWLAQPAHGQQGACKIFLWQQDDVKVAMEAAVLETIVEQMEPRGKLLLREQPGLITVCADNYRHTQLARNKERLVTEL
jgi:hypothetical protein